MWLNNIPIIYFESGFPNNAYCYALKEDLLSGMHEKETFIIRVDGGVSQKQLQLSAQSWWWWYYLFVAYHIWTFQFPYNGHNFIILWRVADLSWGS